MASIEVLVKRVEIFEHPNAHSLEVAGVDDYNTVVGKGLLNPGDLVAYIPTGSIVPKKIQRELNLEGKLSGPNKDLVKTISLRGVVSQGLCYPAREGWVEGQDVAEELGITKYTPIQPNALLGEVKFVGLDNCHTYDIKNIRGYPRAFAEGEQIVITEKIHGSWCCFGWVPGEDLEIVTSKGLSAKGLTIEQNEITEKTNLYVRVAKRLGIFDILKNLSPNAPLYIFGEVFGQGLQDLGYGAAVKETDDRIGFRVFDVHEGLPRVGEFLSDVELEKFCTQVNLERVPVLYRGPFSQKVVVEHTRGEETVSGQGLHIREGVVIRPSVERQDMRIGRIQLKSISDDYSTRKRGTEFT